MKGTLIVSKKGIEREQGPMAGFIFADIPFHRTLYLER
jgi:hypothetical protein